MSKRDDSTALPNWFASSLEATRNNYRRIKVSEVICTYCGCAVHIAADLIGAPHQKRQMPLQDFRASVYPFCACAQAMESDRLVNIADQNDEWWAEVAKWYHEKIAKPDSDEHRENMLRGYPTRKLLRFLIDPNE
jgi:hypothetical protein